MSRAAWWLDQDDGDESPPTPKAPHMTSTPPTPPHAATYAGEPFKIMGVREPGAAPVVICYTRKPFDEPMLEGFRRVGWRDVKYRNVRNRKTGDVE